MMRTKFTEYKFYILLLFFILNIFTDCYPIHRPMYSIYKTFSKTELLPYIGLNKTLIANDEIKSANESYSKELELLQTDSNNPIQFDYYLLRSIALKYNCLLNKQIDSDCYTLKGTISNINRVVQYISLDHTNLFYVYKDVTNLDENNKIVEVDLYINTFVE